MKFKDSADKAKFEAELRRKADAYVVKINAYNYWCAQTLVTQTINAMMYRTFDQSKLECNEAEQDFLKMCRDNGPMADLQNAKELDFALPPDLEKLSKN